MHTEICSNSFALCYIIILVCSAPDLCVVQDEESEVIVGLKELANAVVVPHIASATRWTREGMAILAASNVSGILNGYGIWQDTNDISSFLGDNSPKAAPSIVNAKELGLKPHRE
ncbi:hypothetical protein HZA56_02845 [Candidatus Poribacteria bacterium]|nr:hypothetical protein [Candidatus Poribacteria bacterium]